MNSRKIASGYARFGIIVVCVVTLVLIVWLVVGAQRQEQPYDFRNLAKAPAHDEINGRAMMRLIEQQLQFGPRYAGAPGHERVQTFITKKLQPYADKVETQTWQHTVSDEKTYQLQNIIGRFYPEQDRRVILATHYDSQRYAHQDKNPSKQQDPVPGANDSASSTAALLELARLIAEAKHKPPIGIDIVFFDGEESTVRVDGSFADWRPIGSTYFANHLEQLYENKPVSGLVIDMACDRNLVIKQEYFSLRDAPEQTALFWQVARRVDETVFKEVTGPTIRDDHTPLNRAGIPTPLVIDFDYPYWHTTKDTPDKCSAKSLRTVTAAVLDYIYVL